MAKKNNRESGYDELYDEQDDEQNDEAVEDKQASKGDESDEKVSTGQQQAGDLQTASDRIQTMSEDQALSMGMYYVDMNASHPNLTDKMINAFSGGFEKTSFVDWMEGQGQANQPFESFQGIRDNLKDEGFVAESVADLVTNAEVDRYTRMIDNSFDQASQFNRNGDPEQTEAHAERIRTVSQDAINFATSERQNIIESFMDNDQDKYTMAIEDLAKHARRVTAVVTTPAETIRQIDEPGYQRLNR